MVRFHSVAARWGCGGSVMRGGGCCAAGGGGWWWWWRGPCPGSVDTCSS